MSRIRFIHNYDHIISIENLLLAWKEFLKGKKSKKDVLYFERSLMANIIELHNELLSKTYKHSNYYAFNISDPKPRNIHKAKVRDRLLHHAIYRELYPFFDRTFIADSYSCRKNKGTHKAIERFKTFSNKVSKNNTKTVWILKGDIRKFFANIDHDILKSILRKYIQDENILWLLGQVIDSFQTQNSIYAIAEMRKDTLKDKKHIYAIADMCKGLPLGNLTSQLLVNIYMNEFDQFVKHKLKVKYYIRYADDFIILSQNKNELDNLLRYIVANLKERLSLDLHPHKVSIKTLASGVDFLGWVNFPDHLVVRRITKRRMWKQIEKMEGKEETIQSYLGLLSHGNSKKISNSIVIKYKK